MHSAVRSVLDQVQRVQAPILEEARRQLELRLQADPLMSDRVSHIALESAWKSTFAIYQKMRADYLASKAST